MLWAEDLLLLLTDRRTGRLVGPWNRADLALAGSVLDQLWHEGRIEVDHPERPRRPGRIRVLDASPTGDDVLDRVLAMLAAVPRRPIAALHRTKIDLRRRLYERLAERGLVVHRSGRVLGFVPLDVWPAAGAGEEPFARRLAAWWASPARQQAGGDPACASATALLDSVGMLRPVAQRLGAGGQLRDLRRTAALARQVSWPVTAVHQVVTAEQATVAVS